MLEVFFSFCRVLYMQLINYITVNQIHIHIYLGSTTNNSKRFQWIACLYGIFILVIAMGAVLK